MILGKVKKQMLQIEADPCVDGSRDYITGRFCFSDDWSGMQKYAHFQIGSQEPFSIQLDENGEWGRDAHVNLTTGEWFVWLHGTDGTTVITTNVVTCRVIASGTIDGDPFPEVTPSVGEQIIERAQKSATEAAASEEQAKEYAEAAKRAATSFDRAHLKDVAISTDGNSATFTHEDGTTTTFKPKTGGGGGTVDWDDVQNKPEAFPPERHTHSYNDLKDKPSIPEAYDDTEIRKEIEKVSDGLEEVSEELSTVSDEIAHQAQLMPSDQPTVGKLARVAEVLADGSFRMEWVDAPSGGVSDVTVNGTSVVTDGVATIPKASNTTLGLVKAYPEWEGFGIKVNADGYLYVANADQGTINSRNDRYRPITSSNMDYAVKAAMCDGKGAPWEAAEQAAACERLGAEPKKGDWTLKGKMTAQNAKSNAGVMVDLTGCHELVVIGTYTVTGAANLTSNVTTLVDSFFASGSRTNYIHFVDTEWGIEPVAGKYRGAADSQYVYGNSSACAWINEKHIADITVIRSSTTSDIFTDVDIEIYAR